MAGELLRPGVEVIQSFQTASPSFNRPTLVPCVVGPAFEVINVLSSDGSINSKAKYGDYLQAELAISQSSFPDHRSNIDELDVQEDTVKPFMLFAGKLNNLPMEPGSAFLQSFHGAGRAGINTKVFGAGGLALDGKVLVLAIDQPSRLDSTEDVSIIFSGTANLTAEEAADQINEAVGSTVATVFGIAPNAYVQIASVNYGAMSSVTVRGGGSVNTTLEIGYVGGDPAKEERVEGSGFRGQDQNNNTTQTQWIEFHRGDYLVDGVSTAYPSKAGQYFISDTATFANAKHAAFATGSLSTQVPIEVGDYFFADGVRLKDGEIMRVEADRFKVGVINTALSTVDNNGNYITKVYTEQQVGTPFDTAPFAPTYSYFYANNLNWRQLAPTADTVSGTIAGSPAESAVVESGVVTVPASLAGLKIHYIVEIDGVETDAEFTFTGGPFASAAAIATAIGTSIPGVAVTDSAGKIVFTTAETGRLQAFTVVADGSANTALNFSAVTDTEDRGSDVEFRDAPALLTGTAAQTFPFSSTTSETLVIESSADGGSTWTALTRTFTFPGVGPYANVAALLAAINTAGNWDGGTLPTTFTISSVGDILTITSTATSNLVGLRIGSASTAIGVTTSSDILFTSLQSDVGEEELNGQNLQLQFDNNPHIYSTTFTSNSLDLAIDDINATVGAVVASKTTSGDKLKLTSTLEGKASLVTITPGVVALATGLVSNVTSTAAGRPLPDAYQDDSNVLHIAPCIIRDQVSGNPLDQDQNIANLYIQFKALRKDVSSSAVTAGVLRFSDIDLLTEALNPISEDNPLALGLFLAMINAPTFEVKGLGVDEVSAAAPEGTEEAYAKSADFLSAEEIYAIAPLTQNEVIHSIWATHAQVISAPEQGGERIVFINKAMPIRKNPTIALSGTQANSTATANQMLLDSNPASGLIAAGINPGLPIPETDEVYMEFAVDGELRRYSVSSVSGPTVNFRVSFLDAASNVDGFYSTTTLNVPVTNAAYKVAVRGDSLYVPGTNPPKLDYSLVSETVAGANEGFKNRRLFSVFPDQIKTTIDGLEKTLPGYYACAAIAGMCGSQPPQQGFTNFPITGLTGVIGTEKFTKSQQNVMAGGGTYILVQDVQGGPVTSRHQVSTDLTSVETRELSITKSVDFTAKLLRSAVRKFIGVNVVNDQLLDSLGTTIQAVLRFLEEAGVLKGSNLNNLVQDSAQPDTIIVDVTLQVLYPSNYIRVVLTI